MKEDVQCMLFMMSVSIDILYYLDFGWLVLIIVFYRCHVFVDLRLYFRLGALNSPGLNLFWLFLFRWLFFSVEFLELGYV